MIDHDEEYQFADLDAPPLDNTGAPHATDTVQDPTDNSVVRTSRSPVMRNALIVVAVVILAMLAYHFLGDRWFNFNAKNETKPIPARAIAAVPKPIPTPTPVLSVTPPVPEVTSPTPPAAVNAEITRKLTALEYSQQNMGSEVVSVNNQLNGINTNVNELATKMTQLSQIISALTAKVDAQSMEIEKLTVLARPKKVHVVRKILPASPHYYIQAVIPGRAWLIASNGATLTVREGSVVKGYGVIKLIDPLQGRILTSSGQVIKFSQEDS